MKKLWPLLVLASLIASAQDLDRKITFRSAALPATKLVKQLAAETGLPFTASQSMSRDVVLLKVTDVPAREVMDRLAKALDASWISRDGQFILERTAADDLAERKFEAQRRLSDLQHYVARLTASLDKYPTLDAKAADVLVRDIDLLLQALRENQEDSTLQARGDALEKRFPIERTAFRLLQSVKLETIAKLGSPHRLVYSTQPTKMQVPLGSAGQEAMKALRAEQATFVSALEKQKAVMNTLGGNDENAGGSDDAYFGSFKREPARLVLVIEHSDRLDQSIYAELRVIDGKGEVIAHTKVRVHQSTDDQPAASQREYPLVLSPESKELRDAASSRFGSSKTGPLPASVQRRLASPDLFEPLATLASDRVLSIAEQANLNAVAVLSDDAIVVDPERTQVSEANIESDGTEDVAQADGWLTVKPKYPVTQREIRCDRTALAKLIDAASHGPLTSDRLAEAAVKLPTPESNPVFLFCAESTRFAPSIEAPWGFLRFYGNLTMEQRAALKAGVTLTVLQLSPAAREALFAEVYSSPEDLVLSPRSGVPDSGLANPMLLEPTEVMPDGIPAGARISCVASTNPVVFAGSEHFVPSLADPASIARDRFAQSLGKKAVYSDFYTARFDEMQVTIELTPSLQLGQDLRDYFIGPRTAYDQLPDDFRSQVESELAKVRAAAARKATRKPPPNYRSGP